ncbi:MAG: 50S ribosomal protein L9 [Phycisphaerae bacterium]
MRKLLLQTDVQALGKIGDVVQVSEGYARNFLLPQRLAIEPTPKNLERVDAERKRIDAIRAQELAEKKAMAERLGGVEITIVASVNELGVLFGSVGPKDISDALRTEGYNVDAKCVKLAEHIKQVNKYTVDMELAPEVTCSITVWVTPSKDSPVQVQPETQEVNTDAEQTDDDDE